MQNLFVYINAKLNVYLKLKLFKLFNHEFLLIDNNYKININKNI